MEDPTNYFVEQYYDSKIRIVHDRTKRISRNELKNHTVNGIPLIMLVEIKLEEIAEADFLNSLKNAVKKRPANRKTSI